MSPFLISYCLPAKNRTLNLQATLPFTIKAANESPPIEIVIADYGSSDGLKDYLDSLPKFAPGNFLTYIRYEGNPYFNLSHARNIANRYSHGDYLAQSGAEMKIANTWFTSVRNTIGDGTPKLLTRMRNPGTPPYYPHYCPEIAIIERNEFIKAGGFDERIEFYWFEDRDLTARLIRRGLKPTFVPLSYTQQESSPTSTESKKYINYRTVEGLTTEQLKLMMRNIWKQNAIDNVLVANEGMDWGSLLTRF